MLFLLLDEDRRVVAVYALVITTSTEGTGAFSPFCSAAIASHVAFFSTKLALVIVKELASRGMVTERKVQPTAVVAPGFLLALGCLVPLVKTLFAPDAELVCSTLLGGVTFLSTPVTLLELEATFGRMTKPTTIVTKGDSALVLRVTLALTARTCH